MRSVPRPARQVLSFGLCLALSLPFAGCGGKSSSKDGSATIGAKGGTVTLTGGPTLTIPAGALSADTTITITALSDQPVEGALSPSYQFGPEGTTFAVPVTVSFPLSTSATSASVLWSASGTPLTYEAPATTVAGAAATAQVTHFSNGGVFGPLQDGDPCQLDSDHICKVGRLSHWYQLWNCNLTTENVPDGLRCWLPINTQNFSGRPNWLGAKPQTPWDGTCSAGICVPPDSFLISGTVTPPGGALDTEVFLSGTLSAYTYTDAKGFYQFRVVNGTYTLTPVENSHTYTPATRTVTVAGANVKGQDFARASSMPTYTLSGTVSGAVSAGVAVALSGDATASTTTDALGNYSFQVEDGSYTVTPSLSKYLFTPSNIPLTVSGADLPGQDFTAAAVTYSISGTVSGAQAGVTMTLGGSALATTVTDGNGNYSFTGLLGGSYTVTPSMTGYTFLPVSSTVLLAGADVTGLDFAGTATSNPTYTISGTVSGDVVAGVTISLDGSSSTVTDASGAYSFPGIANGSYFLNASLAGYAFTPSEIDLTVSDGDVPQQNFVAVQTTGTVIVTVLTPGTLAPLANAPVYVTPWTNGQVGGSGQISPTVTTDANGTATFTGIAVGTFIAQAKLTNTLMDASIGYYSQYLRGVATGTVIAKNVTQVTIYPPATGNLTVQLLDNGVELTGGSIEIDSTGGSGPLGGFVGTTGHHSGTYNLINIPAGIVTVELYPGYTTGYAGPVETALAPGGNATVTIDLANFRSFGNEEFGGPIDLGAGTAYRWDLNTFGAIQTGGLSGSGTLPAFSTASPLSQFGAFVSYAGNYGYGFGNLLCDNTTTPRLLRTEVHFEPHTDLVTSRSIYAPSDGRFIRYVDRVSNPSSLDINVTMSTMGEVQDTNLAPYLPSSRGTPLDDQGVLIANGYAIGFALGGPGAAVPLQAAWLPDPYINYGWGPFVVHPGETKYVMYFATVRSAASAADAATQTQALVNLTDPDALTDLSAAERAGIVNFAIPQ